MIYSAKKIYWSLPNATLWTLLSSVWMSFRLYSSLTRLNLLLYRTTVLSFIEALPSTPILIYRIYSKAFFLPPYHSGVRIKAIMIHRYTGLPSSQFMIAKFFIYLLIDINFSICSQSAGLPNKQYHQLHHRLHWLFLVTQGWVSINTNSIKCYCISFSNSNSF